MRIERARESPSGRAGRLCIVTVVAASTAVGASAGECALSTLKLAMQWSGEVADWHQASRGAIYQFGERNLRHGAAGLRVAYPKGSYDPAAVRTAGAPLGGAQFRTPFDRMNLSVGDSVGIRYRLTLDDNFQFMRGGKLPGLYGGRANTGGNVPNGTDGFSLRFGWQTDGLGALLAYLPTSAKWGTVFGLGHWRFAPGRTIELAVFVRLNTPGLHDGVVAAWADDALVVYAPDVVFRTASTLEIDGFYFSTFFGGSTPDWATPVDTNATYGRLDVFHMDARALAHCADARPGLGGRKEIN